MAHGHEPPPPPHQDDDPCASENPPESCSEPEDPVEAAKARALRLPMCTLYSIHRGGIRVQTYPLLGIIEVDPDGCLRGLAPSL